MNEGARRAVVEQHASLLPKGVVGVEGDFVSGDAVDWWVKTDKLLLAASIFFGQQLEQRVERTDDSRIEVATGRSCTARNLVILDEVG